MKDSSDQLELAIGKSDYLEKSVDLGLLGLGRRAGHSDALAGGLVAGLLPSNSGGITAG